MIPVSDYLSSSLCNSLSIHRAHEQSNLGRDVAARHQEFGPGVVLVV